MIAATFPGQGSQSIGMLSDLSKSYTQVRSTFDEASCAIGYDLWELVQDGPEDRLNATEYTQPAMLAAGVAVWRCWRARGGPLPLVAAGHSLGEYSALVAFGAIGFPDAVRTAAARGRFMQDAVPKGEGGIAALVGLDDETVVALCEAVGDDPRSGQVYAVNFNAPGQVAIAGTSRAIERAIEAAREAGARRAIRLPMSVPVHCPLMAPATGRLEARLADIDFVPPCVPILHNADIASHVTAESIRNALSAQLANPVRWRQTVRAMCELGARIVIEFGPGRVLTGLARRIDRSLQALSVHDAGSLDAALEAAGGGAGG